MGSVASSVRVQSMQVTANSHFRVTLLDGPVHWQLRKPLYLVLSDILMLIIFLREVGHQQFHQVWTPNDDTTFNQKAKSIVFISERFGLVIALSIDWVQLDLFHLGFS